MKRVYLKDWPQDTSGGKMIVSMQELDFLFHLTGQKSPQEAVEHFAIICMTFFKEPQEVLKALNIFPTGGNVFFSDDEETPPNEEPTYKRFVYEVTVKSEQ